MTSVGMLHAAVVFLPDGVTNPMDLVFDAPMPAPHGQQHGRVAAFGGEAGDRVLDFTHSLALAAGSPLETTDLLQSGPGEVRNDPRAGLQMPRDYAAMFFGECISLANLRLSLTPSSGGKIPTESQRR